MQVSYTLILLEFYLTSVQFGKFQLSMPVEDQITMIKIIFARECNKKIMLS